MMKRIQRPLVDRPRYVSTPPMAVNSNSKPVSKPPRKRKVVDEQIPKLKMEENQIQQPISGSVNQLGEDIKDIKPPIKSMPPRKRKPKTSRKPTKPKKGDSGMFKQMKDKLTGKSKNKDN